ncbi:MAG: alpha/beta fold hydrolase [Phycisphaerales bacterium]|nr:MAG: alpha/beta fold hydrolase [Phycisphaerales bacterium]
MIERFQRLPEALRAAARWERLGDHRVPAMLVHPDWESGSSAPAVLWMHGRTVRKEHDPARYLRLMRAGIGFCAVDLPGHGERGTPPLTGPHHTVRVLRQMHDEIDSLIDALRQLGVFDMKRLAIGGMSAGGMVALARLCSEHRFTCAAVEATTGSWTHPAHANMFPGCPREDLAGLDPLTRIDGWREIPLLAIHTVGDELVSIEGQRQFITALRGRYHDPSLIEFVEYTQTGAPYEHIHFGKMSADAKQRQRDFFARWLES